MAGLMMISACVVRCGTAGCLANVYILYFRCLTIATRRSPVPLLDPYRSSRIAARNIYEYIYTSYADETMSARANKIG